MILHFASTICSLGRFTSRMSGKTIFWPGSFGSLWNNRCVGLWKYKPMSRQVEISVPHQSARAILDTIESLSFITLITHFSTPNSVHIACKVRPKHLQALINILTKMGCGETYGTIDVFPLIMSRPIVDSEKRVKRSYVISDRMTIDEIQVKLTCEILNSKVL
jgi:hypothetical protein